MAKKRRNYTPVRPSPELIAHIEELVLDYLRTHNERAYWTYLLVMLGRTLSERREATRQGVGQPKQLRAQQSAWTGDG